MKRKQARRGIRRRDVTTTALSTRVYKFTQWATPKSSGGLPVATGGLFIVPVNKGGSDATALYPTACDLHAFYAGGFKVTDFIDTNVNYSFDYFRVKSASVFATWINPIQISADTAGSMVPPGSNSTIEIWNSIDLDDATTPSSIQSFFRRQNKSVTVLTALQPYKKVCTYVPHRRISTNVDASQQIVTRPSDWCDARYADTMLFGNLKMALVAPGGRLGYTHVTNPQNVQDRATYPNIKFQYVVELEFKGKQ